MTLREFLKEKAHEKTSREMRERREEWVAAMERFMAQLRGWLEEVNTDNVLDVVHEEVEKREEGLGKYLVPSLRIELGARTVMIEPAGRNSIGFLLPGDVFRRADGRVDIRGGGRRYYLYRVCEEGTERWFATDEETDRHAVPFDREKFEAIILAMLS